MGKESDRKRIRATTQTRTEIDFTLDQEQQKAVIDCIQRSGKLSVRFEPVGETNLPHDFAQGIVIID